MTDIHDIPYSDVITFLKKNAIDVPDTENEAYVLARYLIENENIVFEPISIIEWMMAYNLLQKKAKLPTYTVNQIRSMNQDELKKLSRQLGMKTTNINHIINILYYAGKVSIFEYYFSKFPSEILLGEILQDNVETFMTLCKSNKEFYRICEADSFWEYLYEKYYVDTNMKDVFNYNKYAPKNYKDLFKLCSKLNKLVKLKEFNKYNIKSLYLVRNLTVYNNNIINLPAEIGELVNLERLGISHGKIKTIPSEIGNLINLESLDLGYNQIVSIPNSIGNLTKLQSLTLSGNKITTISKWIGKLDNLFMLYLNNNLIESISEEIGKLNNLRILDLSHNKLIEIPPNFKDLISLERLNLSNNEIETLPAFIGDIGYKKLLKWNTLSKLDLSKNLIKIVPPEIGKLVSLTSLNLSNNLIKTLPITIASIRSLAMLDVSGNPIELIPSNIKNMKYVDIKL